MKRRPFLASFGLALGSGCLSGLPAGSGPRNPPSGGSGDGGGSLKGSIVIETFDVESTDEGKLRVFGTVANQTDTEQSGTVVAEVVRKGETYEQTTDVTVAGGETKEFSVVFELTYKQFSNGGNLSLEVSQ